jgi:hypothetical protein
MRMGRCCPHVLPGLRLAASKWSMGIPSPGIMAFPRRSSHQQEFARRRPTLAPPRRP